MGVLETSVWMYSTPPYECEIFIFFLNNRLLFSLSNLKTYSSVEDILTIKLKGDLNDRVFQTDVSKI